VFSPSPLRDDALMDAELAWREDDEALDELGSVLLPLARFQNGSKSESKALSDRPRERENPPFPAGFSEPSDGLEPSTPSLPWRIA
jgi:hypothetical protein